MAEISPTPLLRKLGIKPGHRVLFQNAPNDFRHTLGSLPTGCRVVGMDDDEADTIDVILAFGESKKLLQRVFPDLRGQLAINGGLWLCWPKKASGVETDLSDQAVQQIGLDGGLVDNRSWPNHASTSPCSGGTASKFRV